MAKHIDSGAYCTVAHFDENGTLLPECIQCAGCNEFIRPENMDEECVRKVKVDDGIIIPKIPKHGKPKYDIPRETISFHGSLLTSRRSLMGVGIGVRECNAKYR